MKDKALEEWLQSLDKGSVEDKARLLEERIRREQAKKEKHEVAKAVIGFCSTLLLFFSLGEILWGLPSDQATVVQNVTDEKILSALGIVVGGGWILQLVWDERD